MNKPSPIHGHSSLPLLQEIERYAYHTWPAATTTP